MPGKRAIAFDDYVASRIKFRRVELQMSRSKLAKALGLTFKQIQKYEQGESTVSSGRLQQIATILEVPVTYFFEGLAVPESRHPSDEVSNQNIEHFFAAFQTDEGVRLAKAFTKITSDKIRHCIERLAADLAEKSMAEESDASRGRNKS